MRHLLPAGASLATAFALLLSAASPAAAAIGMSSSMSLPSATAAGQQNLAGSFTVSNTNTSPNNTESNTVTQMKLAASCAADGTTASACSAPDPGVFYVDSPASGDAATSCAGSTFTVSAPDANGIVTFTRVGGALVLPPPGGANSCKVNFTFDVLKVPTIDVDGALGGVQTFANLLASATGNITPATASTAPTLKITVDRGAATMSTHATHATHATQISDTATLTSSVPGGPTGTVTFTLYAPGDTNCTGTPLVTTPGRPISGGTATSGDYYPPEGGGSYRWRASYSGDANHVALVAACNEPNEVSVVACAPPPAPITASDTTLRGDFNGDGIGDLAIGVPGEDVGSVVDAGAVHVLYGTGSGVSPSGSQLWNQSSSGIADSVEAGDRFGSTLVAGDFNGDGRDDLAIGSPTEDVGSVVDAGAVNVIYGSVAGLSSTNNQLWNQSSAGIADGAQTGDRFGSALAAGSLDSDGVAELVVGVPNESVGAYPNAGIAHVIFGGGGGLTAGGSQVWGQNSGAIVDIAEACDYFGASLAVAAFDSVGGQDLAIGAPREGVRRPISGTDVLQTINGAGVVHVIYGSASGPVSTGNQLWSQESPGIGEDVDGFEGFGQSLAAGSLDEDSLAELVIGAPLETVGFNVRTGIVHVIRGTEDGLSATGSEVWSQNSSGIADITETHDHFGTSLAIGAIDGTAGQDLAIGVPGEGFGGSIGSGGAVHVIYGSAGGLTSAGTDFWHEDSAGIADTMETGDRFGSAVALGDLNGDSRADLVVGVPNESVGTALAAGVVHVIPGAAAGLTASGSQLWSQNTSGIADSSEAGDAFGGAVGG